MDGGTSVHEKKKPENKATTHQSYDQKTVADRNRRKDKKMKSELKTGSLTNLVHDKKNPVANLSQHSVLAVNNWESK